MNRIVLFAFAATLATASSLMAQRTVSTGDTQTAVVTIQAIDSTTRSITLRTENGEEDTFQVSPEIKRFDELKVGDRVKLTYTTSTVYQLRKPGQPTGTAGDRSSVTPGNQARPGGTISRQLTTTVTVKAVNMDVPSITVVTSDGRTVTRKVDDKKNLEGVQVGDHIDITYTESLVTSIEPSR
jgi:Cu/Ag efflux protein CusF